MSYSAKILWGEGLFLHPQHSQRQNTYHRSRLHAATQVIQPYAWGIHHAHFDTDVLVSGTLRVVELSLFFPDGELYFTPQADALPPPLVLDAIPAGVSELAFHIVLHPLQDNGGNYREQIEGASVSRSVGAEEETASLYTGAEPAAITHPKKSVKLIAETGPREQFISLPVVRARRTGTGGFELDENFVAPSMAIDVSAVLYQRLRQLLDTLQAKVNALYGFHRESAKSIVEFRFGDVAPFQLLRIANATFTALLYLYHHPDLHLEYLFQEMLHLAGVLMTFTRSYTLAGLPAYDRNNPGPVFAEFDTIVRELLDTVISTRYFATAFEEARPSFHLGRINSGKTDDQTSFYLSVSTDMPAVGLVEAIPVHFKVGVPDDVEKLVLSSMPGVSPTYMPQVSPTIPVRPGTCYFAVGARGMLYEHMLRAQIFTTYTPASVRELKLELITVTS